MIINGKNLFGKVFMFLLQDLRITINVRSHISVKKGQIFIVRRIEVNAIEKGNIIHECLSDILQSIIKMIL